MTCRMTLEAVPPSGMDTRSIIRPLTAAAFSWMNLTSIVDDVDAEIDSDDDDNDDEAE